MKGNLIILYCTIERICEMVDVNHCATDVFGRNICMSNLGNLWRTNERRRWWDEVLKDDNERDNI